MSRIRLGPTGEPTAQTHSPGGFLFRNPLGRTARIGSLVMGVALAAVSITPLFPVVSAAGRPTIAPAPFAPSLALNIATTAIAAPIAAPKTNRQNPLAGLASWYGAVLAGHHSADGEIFDEKQMTAAHNTLPFGTKVRVVDLGTGRSVIVRITDRGTFSPGRVIDLSSSAAGELGILSAGIARVRLEVLKETTSAQE